MDSTSSIDTFAPNGATQIQIGEKQFTTALGFYKKRVAELRAAAVALPPVSASWWARERHAERAYAVGVEEKKSFMAAVWNESAFAAEAAELAFGFEFGLLRPRLQAAYDTIGERGCAQKAHLVELAALTVPFLDEVQPEPSDGSERVGLAKGCASVRVTAGAIARHGGGERGWVIFHDEEGKVLDAWEAVSEGRDTHVRPMGARRVRALTARGELGPVMPVVRTEQETVVRDLFGGA